MAKAPEDDEDGWSRLLLTDVTAGMRHDLRNKLTAVRNATFYLRKRLETQAQALWAADPRVPAMFGVVETELAAAEVILEIVPPPGDGMADVRACIADAVAPFRFALDVQVEDGPRLDAAVAAAELRLAIGSLVARAMHARGAPAAPVVAVRAARIDQTVVVEVDARTADVAHGLGPHASRHAALDLAVARRVAARWGGKLALDGEGAFATARLSLPVGVAPVVVAPAPALATTPQAARAIVIDDADAVRLTLAGLLEDAGFTVVEAASLAEARAQIATAVFDVAIVDLNLGDGLGTTLFAELRRSGRTRIALLTGNEGADRAGADVVMTKGGDILKLVEWIGRPLAFPKP